MIRVLRKRHLRMMILIALIVPVLLAAALLLRRPLATPDPAIETTDNPVSDVAPTVDD
jgi:hypothetical protein